MKRIELDIRCKMSLLLNLSLLTIFILSLYYYFYVNAKRKYKFPPGPRGLSILGTVLSVGKTPHVVLKKWANIYGPIFQTKFGLTDVLVLDDAKLIREAFNNPAFSGRVDNKVLNFISGGKVGILNADGQEWIEQRRFVLRTLRDFGFGKQSTEHCIKEEVNDFLKWMKNNEGQLTSVNTKFTIATVNSLWTMVAGQRNDQDDPMINDIIDRANQLFADVVQTGVLLLFPKLVDILPNVFLRTWNRCIQSFEPLVQIFTDAMDDHIKHPADENNPRDLIDVYLAEVKNTTDPNSSFYKERGYKTLVTVIGDLYGAGAGTTSVTLTWTVLYLIKFPGVQEKLQKELDEVIGKNRLPTLSDKPQLPYTEALMLEILRFSSILPIGVFHEAMEDTRFHDYDVKKGTMIIGNLYSVHFNPTLWGDPENFRPERFLSPDEKKVVRSENLLAFSAGRRQCLGESLARYTFFLFLTSIYQRFQILADPAHPDPVLEPEISFLLEAQKFTVLFKDRVQ